jgi:hypothetical protein
MMSLVKWQESVVIAKRKLKLDPKKFVRVKGKLLKEAQKVYSFLRLKQTKS